MPKFQNISFESKEKLPDSTKKNVTALTFMQCHWGPVNIPTEITKETLKNKFGFYDSDTENDWMQAYNFGTYTDNLEIYRVANLSSTPTFDGVTNLLTSIVGSSHAHLFINTADQTSLHSVWHETNNGSDLLYHKNDEEEKENEPTFASAQILCVHGKYVGDEGNNIGISIASYLDDIKSEYIFKEYYEVDVTDVTGFATDDNVIGLTTKTIGTIKRILGNTLYIDVTSGKFENGEIIYCSDVTISNIDSKTIATTLGNYLHGATVGDDAYYDGIYSPLNNRIYLIPYNQCDETNWHYIDCDTGDVVAYEHGATVINYGYRGGVYNKNQKRIYLVPFAQAPETNWHYIDCDTGDVVAYEHGITTILSSTAYSGGEYDEINNRIYFAPYNQGPYNWHYVDCSDNSVIAYNTILCTAGANAYLDAVFSPNENKIYFVPNDQADETNWHYINLINGNVVSYAHGATVVNYAYESAVFSPYQNRIYFVPRNQSTETNWHYIDCDNGNIVSYAHGATVVSNGYNKGYYESESNRIYFSPSGQSDDTNWHYIDCDTGNVVAYAHGGTISNSAFSGIVKSPKENKLYLVPY